MCPVKGEGHRFGRVGGGHSIIGNGLYFHPADSGILEGFLSRC